MDGTSLGTHQTALIASAVALGKLPGEPAAVLRHPGLLARILGQRTRPPLADPRLEVIRAISASLNRGVRHVGADLLAAAHQVGWTTEDLSRTFPGAALQGSPA